MALAQLAKGVAAMDPKLSTRLDEASEVARSISNEVRTTSYLLHPPLLDETGLKSALAWYVQGFQERSDLRATLELPANLGRLTPDVEIMIFRIVQECLTNVLRHSKSETVAVRLLLSESTEMLTLEVQDQGKGIAPDKLKAIAEARTAGVGVRGMRERLMSVGGELEIFSDGNGTLVRGVVPLSPSGDTLPEATSEEQRATT
jgi:two-component system, NarL family, sensor kinase